MMKIHVPVRKLYFCQGPGAIGYVVDVVDGTLTERNPGLQAASWSPDGRRIAGGVDGELVVWVPGGEE